jgi:hypothetical protein
MKKDKLTQEVNHSVLFLSIQSEEYSLYEIILQKLPIKKYYIAYNTYF